MSTHSKTIAKNASIVGGATLASRILGFVRDMIIAFTVGAGPMADAFFVAFRLPNVLRRLFAEGSLTMAFIPVFTRTRKEDGEEEAFVLARSMFAWLIVVLGILCTIAMVFARPITMAIAPGFLDNPEHFNFTVTLVRICFPYILFISSVALCMGILNSMGHFLAPALAPCALNIALISSALLGYFVGGNVALYLPFGVLLGGILQFLLQQPFLYSLGFSWRGAWSFANKGVRRVGRLMLPTVFGAAVYQVNILVITLLASFLPTGSISYLFYADRLVQFPLGVFGIAIGTAALPSLSKLAAEGKRDEFNSALDSSLGLSLFIALPATAGLMALGEPVLSFLFQRGQFSPEDVTLTAQALIAYTIGLPAVTLVRPLVSAFYAHEDTRTPMVVAVICMVVNIGLGYLLMGPLKHVGLALAVSISGWLNAILLGLLFGKRFRHWPQILKTVCCSTGLSLMIGFGAWKTDVLGMWAVVFIPLWAIAYFGLAYGCGIAEARMVGSMIASRLKRRQA